MALYTRDNYPSGSPKSIQANCGCFGCLFSLVGLIGILWILFHLSNIAQFITT